jgi:hypothetical protein
LSRLPERTQSIAKTIVAYVAESTTSEYPYLQVVDAMRAPELDVEGVTSRERSDAYGALRNERIIEEDSPHGRVRIRVPLTAAALRVEGPKLRREALIALQD